MNSAGYVLGAVGVALLFSPTGAGLLLLLRSGLRGGIWVAIWWAMAGVAVNILNHYAPAYVHDWPEQLINLLLALLSWMIAYPLCQLLHLSLRVDEGLTKILISMTGALAFWRVVIYDMVLGGGINLDTTVALTCVLSLLLTFRLPKSS